MKKILVFSLAALLAFSGAALAAPGHDTEVVIEPIEVDIEIPGEVLDILEEIFPDLEEFDNSTPLTPQQQQQVQTGLTNYFADLEQSTGVAFTVHVAVLPSLKAPPRPAQRISPLEFPALILSTRSAKQVPPLWSTS